MADTSTVTYELNGKSFQFKIPKAMKEDQDYIDKTAQIAFDTKYGPPPKAGNPPVINPNTSTVKGESESSNEWVGPQKLGKGDIRVDPVSRHDLYSGAKAGHGMEELGGALIGPGLLRAPLQTLSAMGASGGAAAMGLPWYAQLAAGALAGSPKFSGAIKGGIGSIVPTATNIVENAGPTVSKLSKGLGGAVGYGIGKWPGLVAGRDIGPEILPPLLRPDKMVSGIANGAMEGASGKPVLPQIMRSVPEPSPTFSGETGPKPNVTDYLNVNDANEGYSFKTPQSTPQVNIPKQTDYLNVNDANEGYSLPGSGAGEYFRPRSLPSPTVNVPESNFTPGPNEYVRPRSANPIVKIKPASENFSPATESVPPSTRSVNEESPSSKSLSLVPSSEVPKKPIFSPEAQAKIDRIMGRKSSEDVVVTDNPQPAAELAKKAKIPNEVSVNHPDKIEESKPNEESNTLTSTEEIPEKPKFTQKMMGQIAKHVSGTKPNEIIKMGEVGRYIHLNDVGEYEPATFGKTKDYGATRYRKTDVSPAEKGIWEWKSKLIKQGIEDYFKDPESSKWPTHKDKD